MTDRIKSIIKNARKQSFEYNGAKITVRESLAIDRMRMPIARINVREEWLADQNADKPKKQQILIIDDYEWNQIVNFVLFVMRTVNIKGKLFVPAEEEGKPPIEFYLPNENDSDAVWYESYDHFLCIPLDLYEQWNDALVKVDRVDPDPEVLPGGEKSTTTT